MGELVAFVAALAVVVIASVALVRLGVLGKKRLPPLPASGPLAVTQLGKYYELRDPPLAWERIRGWDVNQAVDLGSVPPVEHVILTPRLLHFCTVSGGKLRLVFNFFVDAIERVTFNRSAFLPGEVGPGQGLVVIFTPSGQTRMIATAGFAEMLGRAIRRARDSDPGPRPSELA
ncbi:MAG TPA: hypothetical protein VGK73_35765 [Polyangiaceae bacterium]